MNLIVSCLKMIYEIKNVTEIQVNGDLGYYYIVVRCHAHFMYRFHYTKSYIIFSALSKCIYASGDDACSWSASEASAASAASAKPGSGFGPSASNLAFQASPNMSYLSFSADVRLL